MTEPANTPVVQHVTDMYVEQGPSVHGFTEPTTGSLQRLEAEALAMDKAFRIAKGLAPTQMVPEHFQQAHHGETAIWNLAAAIMYGAELGLSAVQSAQNVFVVKGKPAVYARTMAAQVRRAGYKIEEVEASDDRVVWRAERDGKWATSEWTIARAETAGYTKNDRYKTNTIEMLRAKAIAEVCRIQYQDVLLGMAYSVEELQLDNVTVQRVVKREAQGAEKLREIAAKANAESEQPEPKPEPQEEDADDDQPATADQVDLIRKLYRARGMTGQAVLDDVVQVLCRESKLPGLQKLTEVEAEAVLELLQEPTL